ncbi:putative Flavinator of succinate dehydrogenase [Trypanosoma vivax]|uniref:Succinate dehydrogenase assembly factor 2, mitochondrial n=1 Tax=Trypanosoma vivax (strain Y486) TaxID=1055687 RepID=G0TWS1_TRYVY|nr:hypothetical protein TRVL_00720 [Trypanosoma vivax]KAH8614019.1 putative Flavinator of succinate dehydrogenase [Trypanosoma vivax]CCC48409.1 conserved hypothetical protein [Trypanosoma vivax Y486]
MLRQIQRFAMRAKNHNELVKAWHENAPLFATVTGESDVTFRDVRPTSADESDEVKRRRLLYQSSYRGMAEMDIILGSFAQRHIESMARPQLEEYDRLLRHFDNDLYRWLVMGSEAPVDVSGLDIFGLLRDFVKSEREQFLGSASLTCPQRQP